MKVPQVRFKLRTLMILVLLTGCWIGWKANRARDQRLAAEVIRASRGKLFYDFQETGHDVLNPKVVNLSKQPPAPKWLHKAIGDEYFQEVSQVDIRADVPRETLLAIAKFDHLVHLTLELQGSKVDTSAIGRIAGNTGLQSLSLGGQSVNDAVLAKLSGAKKLRRLTLVGTPDVTDAGMASVALLPDLKGFEIYDAPKLTGQGLMNLRPRLADLQILTISQTGITEESMAFLDDCRNLKVFEFDGEKRGYGGLGSYPAKLGDAGLAHLCHLESLTTLSIFSTEVSDGGLKTLSGLRNLRSLTLCITKITSAGFVHLEKLVDLEKLSLWGTPLMDEGLEVILKLKGLKALDLRNTNFSPQAIAKLQAARPSLLISK